MMGDYKARGAEAFNMNVGFDEYEAVSMTRDYIIREFELDDLQILRNEETSDADTTQIRLAAVPGKPQYYFYN
jgi:hypothetical protein